MYRNVFEVIVSDVFCVDVHSFVESSKATMTYLQQWCKAFYILNIVFSSVVKHFDILNSIEAASNVLLIVVCNIILKCYFVHCELI